MSAVQNFSWAFIRMDRPHVPLGFQIWPVYSVDPSEQNHMKNFRETEAWAYPGTAQFFGYPLLSREREKLRISNLASILRGSIRIKAH